MISTNIDTKEEINEASNSKPGEKAKQAVSKPIVPLSSLSFPRNDNVMLVLGSEGEGVSNMISELSTAKVMIPPKLESKFIGKAPFNMVDSLNVGVSAATILYHI